MRGAASTAGEGHDQGTQLWHGGSGRGAGTASSALPEHETLAELAKMGFHSAKTQLAMKLDTIEASDDKVAGFNEFFLRVNAQLGSRLQPHLLAVSWKTTFQALKAHARELLDANILITVSPAATTISPTTALERAGWEVFFVVLVHGVRPEAVSLETEEQNKCALVHATSAEHEDLFPIEVSRYTVDTTIINALEA